MAMKAKRFSFQIHFSEDDRSQDKCLVNYIVRSANENGGIDTLNETLQENNSYFANIDTTVKNYTKFWSNMKVALKFSPFGDLTRSMIVFCEGDRGWDDYLLLSHFLESEELDVLPEN